MKILKSKDTACIRMISYLSLSVLALLCLLPFMLIISASFTDEKEIWLNGYTLFPRSFSAAAYGLIFRTPQKILRSYGVTIFITVIGTAAGLFIMSMAAFALCRKDFKYRHFFSFYFYFTTLFSGGLVPFYILIVKTLHLRDNMLSIILPSLLSVWSILLMRNFMRAIPDSLPESAKIDGAGDFRIYMRIILPLSGPSLATIGLFQALGYWNEWYNAMLFIQDQSKLPLQLFLRNMLNSKNIIEMIKSGMSISRESVPTESMKMAMAVVATGPVVIFYPLVQKYFVAGLTVGSVKA